MEELKMNEQIEFYGSISRKELLENLKVLIVEDEEMEREELSIYLKRRVGRLYTAMNGIEALKLYENNCPDLIITDLKMPEMGGIEFVEQLRKNGSRCPVIITSAMSDAETIIRAVDLGIVKYAVKPLDVSDLVELMETLAFEILKREQGETILEGRHVLGKEEKKELEKNLKSDVAFFLKNYAGKGPRDVNVFIKGNLIEVKAVGVLTLLEINLVRAKRNYSMVDFNRNMFYKENISELEKRMAGTLKAEVRLLEIRSNSEKDLDEMVFSIL